MYVIKRTNIPGYVAPSGSQITYTSTVTRARVFRTHEEAERERCVENEVVVLLSRELQNHRG